MCIRDSDTGVNVSNSSTVFYQQVAAGLEAVSNTWNFNAYALVPVGTNEYRLNSNYFGGSLDTYGLDVGYSITPEFKASVGYYYQQGDLGTADGSGVKARLAYNLTNVSPLAEISPTTSHLIPGFRQTSNIVLVLMVTVHQALESSYLW